jgi:hypothetical protein
MLPDPKYYVGKTVLLKRFPKSSDAVSVLWLWVRVTGHTGEVLCGVVEDVSVTVKATIKCGESTWSRQGFCKDG